MNESLNVCYRARFQMKTEMHFGEPYRISSVNRACSVNPEIEGLIWNMDRPINLQSISIMVSQFTRNCELELRLRNGFNAICANSDASTQ